MAIPTGSKAPDFTLKTKTAEGLQDIRLSDHIGHRNTVLLFFPLAFTGVCTTEMCDISGGIKAYQDLNAQVIGISVDSLFTLHQFKEHNQFTFPLLSDFNKDVSRAYNCFYEDFVFDMKGVSRRGVFVIDSEGVICHREVLESAGDLPDFNLVQSTLEKDKVTANN